MTAEACKVCGKMVETSNGIHVTPCSKLCAEVLQLRRALVLVFQVIGTRDPKFNESGYAEALNVEWNETGLRLGAFRPAGAEVNR